MRPLAIRSVLAATDLTSANLPALRAAAQLADLAEARLTIIHVTPAAETGAESELKEHLRRAEVPLRPESVRIELGAAGEKISAAAKRVDADVVVLGPHRPGRPRALGNTADYVVRAVGIPCLILPAGLRLPLRSVLAPLDANEVARGALAVAFTWSSALRERKNADTEAGTRLLVLHVALPDGAHTKAAAQVLEREIATVRERLETIAGVQVQEAVQSGIDPAQIILQQAENESSDLVVMGTRARVTASGQILGSVSSAVVRQTLRPVLLVPPAVWKNASGELPT